MTRTRGERRRATLKGRLLALLCGVLSVTASFDTVLVNQVLDGSLYVRAGETAVTEADDAGEEDDDMLRPLSSREVHRSDRKQERRLPGFGGLDAHPGRLPLSVIPHLRGLPCHPGSEHAGRNGLGVPLLC
jgi:hypothetical protein